MDPREANDLASRPIEDLVADPLLRDHEWMRSQISRSVVLARRLELDQQGRPGLPVGLAELLTGLQKSLDLHFEREEKVVFPLVLSGRSIQAQEAIRGLETEHHDLREALRAVRRLTSDLLAPPDASTDWSELYIGLRRFEERAEAHTRFEYEVFFPRVFYGRDERGAPPCEEN